MPDILLTTLNARYSHCSMGLRYLYANMGQLQDNTEIREFVIDARPIDVVEQLLSLNPKIIGLGVYIWNIEQCTEIVSLIKTIAPEVFILLGGPEVSFEHQGRRIINDADYILCGTADLLFAETCTTLLQGKRPLLKILSAPPPKLSELRMPYEAYTDVDISTRNIYVEASRGCPFKCEFCLSSLDKTAWAFDLDEFLDEMEKLYQRGARRFRFVDRTFNLKANSSARILQFFLDRMDETLFVHFEVIPDHLPDILKDLIPMFPAGTLQFEVGVQSFNPEVQQLISRKQDNEKTKTNLKWLREDSQAHIHADLIAGLPGENLESFAKGFDELISLGPHEIQVGILKRLRGSPIIRHTAAFDLRFNPAPPYNILRTRDLSFEELQRINRFARYWDLIANSGRFYHSLPVLLADKPFSQFMALSDWIYQDSGKQHKLSLQKLYQLVYFGSQTALGMDKADIETTLKKDFAQSGMKGQFERLITPKSGSHLETREKIFSQPPSRQGRHMPR